MLKVIVCDVDPSSKFDVDNTLNTPDVPDSTILRFVVSDTVGVLIPNSSGSTTVIVPKKVPIGRGCCKVVGEVNVIVGPSFSTTVNDILPVPGVVVLLKK